MPAGPLPCAPLENTSKCPALTVSLCSCNFLKNLLGRQSRSSLHLQPRPRDSVHLSPERQARNRLNRARYSPLRSRQL